MSDTNIGCGCGPYLWGFWLPFFIAIKLAGTSLAAWSWWWLLMPIVPLLSILVKRWGL